MVVLKRPWFGLAVGTFVSAVPIAAVVAVEAASVSLDDVFLSEQGLFAFMNAAVAHSRFWSTMAMFVPVMMVAGMPALLLIGWPLWTWVLSKGLASGVAAFWVGLLIVAAPMFLVFVYLGEVPDLSGLILCGVCVVSGAISGLTAWTIAYENSEALDA